jgi:lipopolysaccharide assembly protein A
MAQAQFPDTRQSAAHRGRAPRDSEDQTVNAKLFFVLLLLGATVLFIIQNVAVVEIQFLFWSMQMSRSLLMFLLLAVGILIGWFLHAYLKHRRAR